MQINLQRAVYLTKMVITEMQKSLALPPLHRIGKVEEIAGVAVMLASKTGGFITGQNITVDGKTTISDGN